MLVYVIIRSVEYEDVIKGVSRRLMENVMEKKYSKWPNLKKIDLYDASNICWMGMNTIPVVLLISYGI